MDGGDGVYDDVKFLTGSPQRGAVLRALCDEPCRPTDLADRIDATRTTIQRILSGFVDRGWAYKRDGRYRASPTGRRVFERFEALRSEVETARDLRPVADRLGQLGSDLPAHALAAEDVTVATGESPYAPLDRFIEWIEDCDGDHVRVATPVVAKTFERFAGGALPGDTTLELIVGAAALEVFGDLCERAPPDEERAVDFYVHPDGVRAGIALCDDRVCLGLHDEEDSALRALVESTHPAVVEWARTRFEELRTAARPLEEAVGTGE